MASKIYLLVSLIAAVCFVQGHDKLPDYIHVCSNAVPNIVECIQKSVETIRPYLLEGIPELDIPKIEPIVLGDLLLSEKSRSSDGGLTITAKDIVAFGASNYEVKKIEVVEFSKKYLFEIAIPELYVKGRYAFDGMILVLPLKGAGKFTGNFTNCNGIVSVTLEDKQEGAETHVQVKKMSVRVTVAKGRLNFENLINGNKELSKVLSDSISNDFAAYSKEVIPLIEKSLARYFANLANKVIDRFTKDQLFPQK